MAKTKKGKAKVKAVVRKLWTAKDVKLLRTLATRQPVRQIAAALGRSVLALRYKAHMLAISLRPKKAKRKK
jgi:hypothetical protein